MHKGYGAVLSAGLAIVMAAQLCVGQGAVGVKTPLTFEVATIKPDDPGKMVMNELRVYPGGRLVIHGHPLQRLIVEAFDVPYWALAGGDKWITQMRFDIEAKPPEDLRKQIAGGEFSNMGIQDERIRTMLQTLLIERFHLKFHKESQQGTVYRLERGSGPLKLQPVDLKLYTTAEDGTVAPTRGMYPTGDMGMASGAHVGVHQSSMHELAMMLSTILQAPVTDQTGLTGFYNFKSDVVVTDDDFKTGGPMHLLVDAVPEMGLKLVKAQGTVEKMVIDGAEMPTDN